MLSIRILRYSLDGLGLAHVRCRMSAREQHSRQQIVFLAFKSVRPAVHHTSELITWQPASRSKSRRKFKGQRQVSRGFERDNVRTHHDHQSCWDARFSLALRTVRPPPDAHLSLTRLS